MRLYHWKMETQLATSILSAAEELIKAKNWSDALSMLNGINVDSLLPDGRAYYQLLYSESKLYLGDYDLESHLNLAI